MTDLTNITGYRTNEDNTETPAYFVADDGRVTHCAHDERNVCVGCFEADHRLFRNYLGDVVRFDLSAKDRATIERGLNRDAETVAAIRGAAARLAH